MSRARRRFWNRGRATSCRARSKRGGDETRHPARLGSLRRSPGVRGAARDRYALVLRWPPRSGRKGERGQGVFRLRGDVRPGAAEGAERGWNGWAEGGWHVPRRKVAEPEPAAPRCEVCDTETPSLSARHGGFGLRCCFECVRLPSSEVAV